MGRQIRHWDFLSPVGFRKFIGWFQHIIPSGVYHGGNLSIDDVNNRTVLSPSKFIMPSGKVVEELDSVVLSLPTVSLSTPSDFTVIAYGIDPATVRTSDIRYLIQEGFQTDESLLSVDPSDLGLSTDNYEFLVIGYLNFDGDAWTTRSIPISQIDATNRQQQLVVPFPYTLVSSSGTFQAFNNPTYGPVYQNTGVNEISVGIQGIIENANIRVIGGVGGEVRVTLMPISGYAYTQTFDASTATLLDFLIEPVFADNPTLANSTISLRLSGAVSLVDITTR